MGRITLDCRDKLNKSLSTILDTRDKRYMFLRMEFPRTISFINLEGAANYASHEIIEEFQKRGMLGSLIACLNSKLDTNLNLETQDD